MLLDVIDHVGGVLERFRDIFRLRYYLGDLHLVTEVGSCDYCDGVHRTVTVHTLRIDYLHFATLACLFGLAPYCANHVYIIQGP